LLTWVEGNGYTSSGVFLLTPTLLRWSPLSAAQMGELRKEGYIILVGANIFIWDLLFLLMNW